jgi:hypothetical protein
MELTSRLAQLRSCSFFLMNVDPFSCLVIQISCLWISAFPIVFSDPYPRSVMLL